MGIIILFSKQETSKKKKMSRVSLFLVLVCFTAWFSSGSAIDCLVCTGGSFETQCGENESGTSQTCQEEGAKCGKAECEINGQTVISRGCAPADTEDGCKTDDDCTACACNSDNCNYATKAEISAISVLAVIFVSMLT